MQKVYSLKLLPSEAADHVIIKERIAQAAGVSNSSVTGYQILKKSIDARGKQPWVQLSVQSFVDEPPHEKKILEVHYKDVRTASRKVIVVGSGPAGLFAALRLMESGIQPIILERGKDVRSRRRDLAILNKDGILNPESNYCFGEGGAGTYSDGKLYTRSTKRGDVNRILNLFYYFGAQENILYESHPHIGTNKLPQIITAIRKKIIDAGGEYWFEKKVTEFILKDKEVTGVKTSDGTLFEGDAVILATGHSARDIFELLYKQKIAIESKPFALGVRVEHPQELIDQIQYHCPRGNCDPDLPPAAYSLVEQVQGTGVFSFCMCPGGIIAPASTRSRELVVNGWSPSKRNNPYANSGIVVQVQDENLKPPPDFERIMDCPANVLQTPLAMMYFQQYAERKAFDEGGGKFVAPAQRLIDFCEGKISADLPACSYLPGIRSVALEHVLPPFICNHLQKGFNAFGRRMKGYLTNEAVIVATESRTSSPIRIPRDPETLHHIQIGNLYPCGEGAGYAGGIVSAAMDGERIADQVAVHLKKTSYPNS